jgi:alkanesulfonate monooxygenase SsuD/methylene tetrahydromethanopterin reductase-like flavin-dependent oxidoreductase (luciferase family)
LQFSIYSELQWWPGKEPAQVYAEVLEQIENADRLGFDTYSAIEHFFFPKFSASPDPIALFSAAAQRTSRINFRTLVHVLPYHNPMVLASRIAFADILMGGRYEFGVGRGHGWIPWRAGVAYGEMVERYDESLEILFTALESGGEPIDYDGKFFQIHDARVVPPPTRKFRVFTGGTSDKDYVLAGTNGWGVVVPAAAARTRRSASSSTSTARRAPSTGTSRTSSWIHACYLDDDRDTRSARPGRGSRASSPAMRRRSSSTRSRRPTTSTPPGTASTPPGSSKGSPRRPTTR